MRGLGKGIGGEEGGGVRLGEDKGDCCSKDKK